jgi:RNA polymerase sigma-70 factor (ECF subfamily)
MADATPDIDALIAAARTVGDARGTLLEVYRPYLTLLARIQIGRRLRGKADPADLVQDTFLEAHRYFDQFRGTAERALLAWLRQVLATRLAQLIRRYTGTRARDVGLELALQRELDDSSDLLDRGLIDPGSSPSEAAARREQGVRLADALERLPPDYREVIILRQLEGRPFKEVADQLGKTTDAVQKLWVRGLARLRYELTGPEPPEAP